MKHMTRLFIALVCALTAGVLGLVPAYAVDLDVTAGDLNLDSGYAVTVGGEQAVTLGGLNEWSAWIGAGAGNGQNYNVGIGYNALNGNTTTYNLAIGTQAMRNNTGNGCVGIGTNALYGNSGDNNTAVGKEAMNGASGDLSVGIGQQALNSNEGYGCIGVGYGTLQSNTGLYSTAIGYNAGNGNTNHGVILLGANAVATDNYQMVIGSDSWQGTVNDVYIGKGVQAVTPPGNVTIHATSSTGAADGANLILTGGTSASGTDGRVIILNELSTPILEITGGSDLAEMFPVRDVAAADSTEMVALLLAHGATK